jgi:ribulose-phosphate 3-epimerase
MSINPGFGGQRLIPESLEKVRKLTVMRAAKNANFRLEIDGGISVETVGSAVRAGAEILVAGNALFGHGNPTANSRELEKAATESTGLFVPIRSETNANVNDWIGM